jgi:hypothetical protein
MRSFEVVPCSPSNSKPSKLKITIYFLFIKQLYFLTLPFFSFHFSLSLPLSVASPRKEKGKSFSAETGEPSFSARERREFCLWIIAPRGVGRKKRVLPSAKKPYSRRGRRNSRGSKAPMSTISIHRPEF